MISSKLNCFFCGSDDHKVQFECNLGIKLHIAPRSHPYLHWDSH